jgi:hypothetical protein
VLSSEVIKREVLEGDKADEARKKITRAAAKSLRTVTQRAATNVEDEKIINVEQ